MNTKAKTPTLTVTMQGLRDAAEARGLAHIAFEEHGRTHLRVGNPKTLRFLEIVASPSRDTGRVNHAATFDGRNVSLKDAAGYMSLMAI